MVDIDKFICDFIRSRDVEECYSKTAIAKYFSIMTAIEYALNQQGIIYKDGQLQRIEDVTPKPFEIKKGKYYMCIKDYWSITYETTIFTKGKVYFSDVRNHLVADNGVSFVWSTNFDDYKDIIRPATEEEISQRMESAKAKEEGYSKPEVDIDMMVAKYSASLVVPNSELDNIIQSRMCLSYRKGIIDTLEQLKKG